MKKPLTRSEIMQALQDGEVSFSQHGGKPLTQAEARSILMDNIDRLVSPDDYKVNLDELFSQNGELPAPKL